MNRLFLSILASLIFVLPAYGDTTQSAKETWEELVPRKYINNPAFAYVENNPALPNVFIYGDSISISYTVRVRELVNESANLYRLHKNGSHSGKFIQNMIDLHTEMQDQQLDQPWSFKWDVIYFNVGLHDVKYYANGKLDTKNGTRITSTKEYIKNLRRIVTYLKQLAPNAKIIFANTTPIPANTPGWVKGDAKTYNHIAREVLRSHPDIKILDLYSVSKAHQKKWWLRPGNVHFNEEGSNEQGKLAARAILSSLPKKPAKKSKK
jgi:lysophospholipase L1-like esterase